MSATDTACLLSIGAVATRAGVSERALRYYEEIGLLSPAGHSPGGCRRYGDEEIARVLRIRELQDLMGFNLDEIRAVMANEDSLEALRAAWRASEEPEERHRILVEGLEVLDALREKVTAKSARLDAFLAELDARAERYHSLLDNWPESTLEE